MHRRLIFFIFIITSALSIPSSAHSDNNFDLYSPDKSMERLGLLSYRFDTDMNYENVIKLTGPAILDKSNTKYIVQNDIIAQDTAFVIKSANIMLDLNGHTVEYGSSAKSKCFGISSEGYHRSNLIIVNGTIRQSQHIEPNDLALSGSSPVSLVKGVSIVELAGLTIEYHSPQTNGIQMTWSPGSIHHNIIRDTGHIVTNRHQIVAAIRAERTNKIHIYSNYIERTRQGGILPGTINTTCNNNIINIDSVASNSFGIGYRGIDSPDDDRWECKNNIIRGIGVHPVGIAVVHNAGNGLVIGNDVEVKVTNWNAEYNKSIGGACYRTTWGSNNILIKDNRFKCFGAPNSIRGKDSWGRAVWVAINEGQKMTFRNNIIIGISENGSSKIPAVGVTGNNNSSGLVFIGNTIASSWSNIMLADYYGEADGYPQFIDNIFTRLKDYRDYYTIRSDADYRISTGVFMGNRYEDGASIQSTHLELNGEARKDALFLKRCTIHVNSGGNPVADAQVVLKDNTGATVAEGRSDENGRFEARLLDHRITNRPAQVPEGIYMKTIEEAAPYTVTVESGKGSATATIDKDADLAVTVDLGS